MTDLSKYLREVEVDDFKSLADMYPDVVLWVHVMGNCWREATVAEFDEYRRDRESES